jgi:hypothetical protein
VRRVYAVTSYGSQGKTVDYILFSDSTTKAATNAQQWYVSISRGRRGIRIFTPDKEQLCENIRRTGHRPLAMEFADRWVPSGRVLLWKRLHGYLLRFGRRAADNICCLKLARHHHHQPKYQYEHKNTRMLVQRPERRALRIEIAPGHSMLLPHDQFMFAELNGDGANKISNWSSPRTRS